MSRKVEAVHRSHPNVPTGLCEPLRQIQCEAEPHMTKEEAMPFPAMLQWTEGKYDMPISELRHEHDDQAEGLAAHGKRSTSGFPSSPRI
ncbi:hemerythrin domain-containing protein [Mesorhizobium sp.]|uniref:hemerythrin domain-containing protein n=1 Tax=Mesorhizobium sp. TaxID=1871066 RepID=UPI00344A9728